MLLGYRSIRIALFLYQTYIKRPKKPYAKKEKRKDKKKEKRKKRKKENPLNTWANRQAESGPMK